MSESGQNDGLSEGRSVDNEDDLVALLKRPSEEITLVELRPWSFLLDHTAKSGQLLISWPVMRQFISAMFRLTLYRMVQETGVDINVLDNGVTMESLDTAINCWKTPPFTLQRLCELLIDQHPPLNKDGVPTTKRIYSSPISYFLAFTKSVIGVSDYTFKLTPDPDPVVDLHDFLFFDKNNKPVALAGQNPEEDAVMSYRPQTMRLHDTSPLPPRSDFPRGEQYRDIPGPALTPVGTPRSTPRGSPRATPRPVLKDLPMPLTPLPGRQCEGFRSEVAVDAGPAAGPADADASADSNAPVKDKDVSRGATRSLLSAMDQADESARPRPRSRPAQEGVFYDEDEDDPGVDEAGRPRQLVSVSVAAQAAGTRQSVLRLTQERMSQDAEATAEAATGATGATGAAALLEDRKRTLPCEDVEDAHEGDEGGADGGSTTRKARRMQDGQRSVCTENDTADDAGSDGSSERRP